MKNFLHAFLKTKPEKEPAPKPEIIINRTDTAIDKETGKVQKSSSRDNVFTLLNEERKKEQGQKEERARIHNRDSKTNLIEGVLIRNVSFTDQPEYPNQLLKSNGTPVSILKKTKSRGSSTTLSPLLGDSASQENLGDASFSIGPGSLAPTHSNSSISLNSPSTTLSQQYQGSLLTLPRLGSGEFTIGSPAVNMKQQATRKSSVIESGTNPRRGSVIENSLLEEEQVDWTAALLKQAEEEQQQGRPRTKSDF